MFHSYGNVTIAGEGLQILTCARHSWRLTIEILHRATPTVTRGIRYNDHLRGSVTITSTAKRLGVELSLLVFMTWV